MIKEKYAKVFIIESTKTINESYYNISTSEAYDAFVKPFLDIWEATKMGIKDVGVGLLYNLRILFTFDVTKKQRLLEAYEQKMDLYDKEWKDVMNKMGSTGDEKLILFLSNPGAVIGIQAVKTGANVVGFVNDIFREQKTAMRDGGVGPDGKPTGTPPGPLSGIANDLKRLFFGESVEEKFIFESEKIDKKTTEQAEEAMRKAGVDLGEIESLFQDFVKMKEDQISKVDEDGIPDRIEALNLIIQSVNLPDLKKTIDNAKSKGIDMGNFLSEFEKEYNQKKLEISKSLESKENSEIVDSLKELPEIKKLGDKATEKDFLSALEKSLFHKLKSNIQKDGIRILQEIEEDNEGLIKILLSPFKSLEQAESLSTSSPAGKEIFQKIKNTVDKLNFKS